MGISTKHKAYAALTITSLVWGSTWVASRIGVQKVPALQLSGTRQLMAGLLFLIFFLFRGAKMPTRRQFLWIISMSFLMFVFANGFSTWSVAYIPSGLAALIAALYPLCVVILEWLFFGKKSHSLLTFLGLIVGVGGVAIVFYENAFHAQPEGYGFGILLSVAGMVAWSLGTIYIARNKYQMNPYYAMGWQMVTGSVFIFLMAVSGGQMIPFSEFPAETWLVLTYLVLFGSILTFIAFIYSTKHLPTAVASLYAYINPIVATIIGSLVLDEKLTLSLLIGTVITLAGVFMVNYSVRKQ